MPENDKFAADFMQERGFIFFSGTDYTVVICNPFFVIRTINDREIRVIRA